MDLSCGESVRGCLHLIDLAGSEMVVNLEVTRERLKEATQVKKLLSILGDVIFSLSNKSAHIPYCNRKLTQIL